MLRRVIFTLAGIAVACFLATDRSPMALAAAPEITGNWQLSSVTSAGESAVCILKIETKDGKPTATVLFSPPNSETTVSNIRTTDGTVEVTVKQSRSFGKQTVSSELAFIGVRGTDAKVILGSTGNNNFRSRAKLTATEKETLTKDELTVRATLPEPMTKAQQLNSRAFLAQNKAALEKDAEKKKALQKEAADARKEADEKMPALYKEVTEKHADTLAASDAALSLLSMIAKTKPTADEATRLVKVIQNHATPYGSLFAGVTLARVAETLAAQPGLEAAALAAIEPSAKALTKAEPTAFRVAVLSAYQIALDKSGKKDAAKTVATELAALELILDTEYLKTVPPFKPTAFAGRKDTSANQVAVMELFTGAQCPPCVAADVAFDGLLKTYKPTDVVLIQYHVHIPGPDPLTIPESTARFNYYRDEFPNEVRGAPSTVFNGKPAAGGGGGMANGEAKYKQYVSIINPLLEKTAEVKIGGKATRSGDIIDIALDVNGGDGDNMKLRVLVVEESIRYVGGNQIRFHHQVVRAMPGGAAGVAIKDKSFKHSATTDLSAVRKELTNYLDDYAKNTRPFPKADRPMDLKALKVIALVQNDKTKEIVQAVQVEVEGKAAGGE